MPFKKTKEGWEYDPKGKAIIPTKPGIFNSERPPMRNKYGWPMKNLDEVDWDRNREVEEKEQDGKH